MADPTRIPHLRFPLALEAAPGGGVTFATVEQGTPDEVRRGLSLTCEVRPDQLPWDDELGITDPAGETDPALAAETIAAELRQIDDRLPFVVDVVDEPGMPRLLRPRITL